MSWTDPHIQCTAGFPRHHLNVAAASDMYDPPAASLPSSDHGVGFAIRTRDQTIMQQSAVIEYVQSVSSGRIEIRRAGSLATVGHAAVAPGTNYDVEVPLHELVQPGDRLVALLYDAGQPDPVVVSGVLISAVFTVLDAPGSTTATLPVTGIRSHDQMLVMFSAIFLLIGGGSLIMWITAGLPALTLNDTANSVWLRSEPRGPFLTAWDSPCYGDGASRREAECFAAVRRYQSLPRSS